MAGHKKNKKKVKSRHVAGSGINDTSVGRRGILGRKNDNRDSAVLLQSIGKLPTFHRKTDEDGTEINYMLSGVDKDCSSRGMKRIRGLGGGYYETYKRATTTFYNWMKETLPNSRVKHVNDLITGVDEILEHNVSVACNIHSDVNSFFTANSGGSSSGSSNDCSASEQRERAQDQPLSKGATPGSTFSSYTAASRGTSKVMIIAPKHIMEELSTSIEFRERHTEAKFGHIDGGDDGHKYMVNVLRYCQSVLRFGKQIAKAVYKELKESRKASAQHVNQDAEDDEDANNVIGGQFAALLLEEEEQNDDAEEEEEEEREGTKHKRKRGGEEEEDKIDLDIIRRKKYPNFDAPKIPDSMTEDMDIEKDLINGDDRFQAVALLQTMEDFMQSVFNHYGFLKRQMQGQMPGPQDRQQNQQQGVDAKEIIQLAMECSVVVNMTTRSVQQAENALTLNHPHIKSFYHVLALVYLPNFVSDIQKLIVDKSRLERSPHLALDYVAEIIECSFHSKGNDRVPAKMEAFSRKSGITDNVRKTQLEEETRKMNLMTSLEIQLPQEEQQNFGLNALLRRVAGTSSHMWLKKSDFYSIGGDSCILNTQNIVQKIMDVVLDNTKLIGMPGFWGDQFDENSSPAKRILGDLNEPFGSCIVPELLEICKRAPFNHLPERSQLLTVLDLLQQHVNAPRNGRTKPVPVCLTFGLHAILVSMYVLQGDGDLARIASYMKSSYNILFDQLEELMTGENQPENAPSFYKNVTTFHTLVNFAKPVKAGKIQQQVNGPMTDPSMAEELAFWNPVIGGEYMLYATYMCSIGLGSATVDSVGQLRFTLHLYNALKQKLVKEKETDQCNTEDEKLDVPILKRLDEAFAKCKAIWVGGRPTSSFGKCFWMTWGSTAKEAAKMAAKQREIILSAGDNDGDSDRSSSEFLSSFMQEKDGRPSSMARGLDPILPEDFCKSYRCLVKQDFAIDEEEYARVVEYTVLNPPTESEKKEDKEHAKRFEGYSNLLTNVNITRDAMDEDEELSVTSTNFPVIGCILLEFTNALSKHMGWDSLLDNILNSYPANIRTGRNLGGGQMRGFNASDLNLRRQAMAHLWGVLLSRMDIDESSKESTDVLPASPLNDITSPLDTTTKKVMDFMVDFFKGIPDGKYTFFVQGNKSNRDVAMAGGGEPINDSGNKRNPLKGTYPYGQTGRTARDPLVGFWILRSGKQGDCVARMIKPGKYTPIMPTEEARNGGVNPYAEEVVRKLRRNPSTGKYRHISSYTLAEVIDLGWDGAMYMPSRGRGHGVEGQYVPFIPGYDSSDDEEGYDPVNIRVGKKEGIIGLPKNEVGLYMTVPTPDGVQVVQLRGGH